MVAMHQHGDAHADGEAVDTGDDRLLRHDDALEKIEHGVAIAVAGHGGLEEVADVVAGGERARHAQDQRRADGVARRRLVQRVGQRLVHVRR